MPCILPRLVRIGVFSASVLFFGGFNANAAETQTSTGDAVRGKSLYEAKCGGCHSVDANRVGPLHRGVVGRVPGTAAGFSYSPAVKKLGGVWTRDRLDQWLQNPQAYAPGTRMYLMVSDATTRKDIIAYLASVSPRAK